MPSSLRPLAPRGSPSHLSTLNEEEDANLFEAPSELVCPITHAVFLDPVLTQAGHAYERKSIEQHLQTTDTDPMSRQPLLNSSLTPVFVLKSRALEYRETTCRLCIDRACSVSPAPRPPIEYLRRAVELCSDAGFLPKGLSAEVVDYVNSHLSNVYDRLVLDMFARGLFENGYRDRAAAVYFHLLVTEEDKAEQATLLIKCLACWSSEIHSSTVTVATSAVDSHVFEKLVQMIDTKESHFSWIIEVSSEAGLGNAFVAKLCQHILFPQLSSSASSSSSGLCDSSLPGGGRGVARSKRKGNLPWETEKEVLLKYCFVLTSSLKEEQAEMTSKMKRLEEKVFRGGSGSGKQGRRGSFSRLWMNTYRNTKSHHIRSDHEDNESEFSDDHPFNNALKVVKKAVQHPIVMATCGAVAVFGDPHHPLVRSTRLVPFLALMNTSHGGGGGGGVRRFSSSSIVEMPESPSVEEVEILDQTTSNSSSNSNEESPSKENE